METIQEILTIITDNITIANVLICFAITILVKMVAGAAYAKIEGSFDFKKMLERPGRDLPFIFIRNWFISNSIYTKI